MPADWISGKEDARIHRCDALPRPDKQGVAMPLAKRVKKVTRKLGRQTLLDPPDDADSRTYSIYLGDAFEWLAQADRQSIHAVVTDPPLWGAWRRPG